LSVRIWIGETQGEVCRPALNGLEEGSGTWLQVPQSRVARTLAALGCAPPPDAALGPLAVARVGRGLEAREVGFAMTLGSLDAAGVIRDPGPASREEATEVAALALRLESGRLALQFGASADHALVWRGGSLDLDVTDWEPAQGKPWLSALPKGEGESLFRRFVDDSVNLLADSHANQHRSEEGRPLLNLLWPWGPGLAFEMPRLMLRYGAPLRVVTEDWALQGAARLAGVSLQGEAPLTIRAAPCPWEHKDDPEEQAYLARSERESGWLGGETAACTVGPFGWHAGPPERSTWESELESGQAEEAVPLWEWVARLLQEGGRPVG